MIITLKKLIQNIFIFYYSISLNFRSSKKQKKGSILIPADFPGGLGDDAMIKSFVKLSKKNNHYILVFSKKNIINTNKKYLIYDSLISHPHYTAWKLSHFKNVYIFGADIMDGAVNKLRTYKLLKIIQALSLYKINVSILSFSLNDKPIPLIVNEYVKSNYIQYFLREPISFKRAIEIYKINPILTADIAFLLEPSNSCKLNKFIRIINQNKKIGRKIIGLNLHYHFEKYSNNKNIIDLMFKNILSIIENNTNLFFVLIPHDYRGNKNDLTLLKKLSQEVTSDNSLLIDKKISSAEVKYLCGKLDGVLSGRMHLLIAALGMGVPVIGIDYQKKFAGLMSHFNLGSKLILNMDDFNYQNKINKRFNHWINYLPHYKLLIKKNMNNVFRLSKIFMKEVK